MIFEPGLIAGGLGCAASGLSILLVRRHQARSVLEATRIQAQCAANATGCTERMESLRQQLASLELGMRDTDDILREGRLSRSTRAQILKVLRSGVTPDTAASTLGIARREVRLLAKVSHLLATYR